MGLTLRLLRHGTTEWTEAGRYCGHADPGLNETGRLALRSVWLPESVYRSVVCSDLRRCRETAAALGLAPTLTAALREFDFGAIEGATWEELDDDVRTALLDHDSFVAPDGESVEGFGARIDTFVEGLDDGRHLLVTHGGVIQHLLRRAGVDRHVGPGEWVDVEISPR
ncbi:MAG: histidine phosphatase family protein [Acidimicrobiales bacterium]